ncbi:hypothetical protein AAW31_18210 [Nitrosomonas communis]|uniref:Uncharacterized protein n=1 Tax=Nitrosomonas communis TaxID=44574 RepID=A0A0F7KK65_9PROT|nr:hypothetical protein AAW31_18210 [Nitrosomonas communis]
MGVILRIITDLITDPIITALTMEVIHHFITLPFTLFQQHPRFIFNNQALCNLPHLQKLITGIIVKTQQVIILMSRNAQVGG